MITRPATMVDAADLGRLYVATRRIAYAPFYPDTDLAAMSVTEQTERWRVRIEDPAWDTVLALDGEGFVHYGHNDAMEAGTGEIEFLYVGTQHQGAGIGKHLIALAEAGLEAMGFSTATLWVYEGNTPARLLRSPRLGPGRRYAGFG